MFVSNEALEGLLGGENNQDDGWGWTNALSLGLGVGELVRQGKVYQIYGRTAETVENALNGGRYVHTNGKIYSQGFRGNQYISSQSIKSSISTAKFARNLGRGFTACVLRGVSPPGNVGWQDSAVGGESKIVIKTAAM